MVLAVQCLKSLSGDMCIDLRGGDVGVAEQHLHYTQIGTVIKQVCSESMAQGVR